jgi:hypothetical protein
MHIETIVEFVGNDAILLASPGSAWIMPRDMELKNRVKTILHWLKMKCGCGYGGEA